MASVLKQKRKLCGYSQQEMAEKVGVPTATYNLYEHGKRGIPYERAHKIANVLNVKIEDLFLYKTFTVSKT